MVTTSSISGVATLGTTGSSYFTGCVPGLAGEITLGFSDNAVTRVKEKNNCKYMLYKANGFDETNLSVEKEFVNKTKTMYITVKGKYEDELTGWKNDFDTRIPVDYNIYDEVSWSIKNGLLTIVLHEIINAEPEFTLRKI